jgi:hypothetical protein
MAFLLLMVQRRSNGPRAGEAKPVALGPQTDSGNMAINALAIKLRAQIISTRWFSEMLLYKQQGKLNFAQMEMLHQINNACREASKLLNGLFDAINTQVPGAVAAEVMLENGDASELPAVQPGSGSSEAIA